MAKKGLREQLSLEEMAEWEIEDPYRDPRYVREEDIDWLAEIIRDDQQIEDEAYEYALMVELYGGPQRRWIRG